MIERRSDLRAHAVQQVSSGRARGQGFVEYALIILFVALAVVLALSLLGPQVAGILDSISSAL